ncbi:MAG: tetratricopeptide repeat protein [Vicingus serpentipes]|nr:tetratricopeptide repeat protein [Vicingus serpentipes]
MGALLLFTLPTFASIQDDYQKANALYNEGNYEEAITTYESILNNNNIAPDIYYNLGNAYYKNNQIPPAILNYERALKLKPDHEDALFNLKMANKKTVDKVERLPELFITNSWRNLVTSRTVSDWAYYTVALVFLALLFFIIYLLTNPVLFKKISFYSGSFFLVLSLFCWLMASQHQRINASSSEAIIFEPTVTIQSEPNTKAEKLFTLHEGTKVTLLEKVNDWSKIKLPNGNVGWVVSSAIEAI